MSTCELPSTRRRARPRAVLYALGVAAALSTAAVSASATPTYPGTLQDDLNMPCAPPCTICHRDNHGGYFTVVKPFGRAMMSVGLRSFNNAALAPALKTLEAKNVDSNGDGVNDVQELREGRDPNLPGGPSLCGPQYGCGARVAPRGRLDGGAFWLAALAALGLLATRRRRRR